MPSLSKPAPSPMHYRPILKCKTGEFRALRELAPEVKANLTPILEIPFISDHDDDPPQPAAFLRRRARKVEMNWGTEDRIMIDARMFNRTLNNGRHPLEYFGEDLDEKGIDWIPVSGPDRDDEYHVAVQECVVRNRRGAAIRLREEALTPVAADLAAILESECEAYGVQPEEVDLILDYGAIPPNASNAVLGSTIAIMTVLPDPNSWRSITVAGTSYPETLTTAGIGTGETGTIDREAWKMYNALARVNGALQRMPDHGDYGITYPELADIHP
ncbi:MAG TPA: hypothetical protein EYG39_12410, partial [Rhodothermales bacterium]|nr:hypothetical protein [Rhodothermales bacterium]